MKLMDITKQRLVANAETRNFEGCDFNMLFPQHITQLLLHIIVGHYSVSVLRLCYNTNV